MVYTKTSLLAIAEETSFFELENFLKYVHFAYKLASFCPFLYTICKYA